MVVVHVHIIMTFLRLSVMRTVLKKKLKLKKGNGGEGQILTNILGKIYPDKYIGTNIPSQIYWEKHILTNILE